MDCPCSKKTKPYVNGFPLDWCGNRSLLTPKGFSVDKHFKHKQSIKSITRLLNVAPRLRILQGKWPTRKAYFLGGEGVLATSILVPYKWLPTYLLRKAVCLFCLRVWDLANHGAPLSPFCALGIWYHWIAHGQVGVQQGGLVLLMEYWIVFSKKIQQNQN